MKRIEFTIDNKDYLVRDIHLQNYKDVMGLIEAPDADTPYEVVEYLSGCPKEELRGLKASDWFFLWSEVEEMILGQNTTAAIQPIIEFMGVKYGLPQIEDMSIGEFADLDIIASGPSPEKRLAEIASIVYRQVVEETPDYIRLEKYTVEGAKKREREFQFLPLSAIKSANAFFLQSASQSLKNMLDSSKLKKTNSTFLLDLEDLERSLQPDSGGPSLTSYLEKIPSGLMTLQNYLSEQPSTGSPGRRTKLENNN
jgi:hypothetical protein